ncbi:MAG: DUF1501 domain-containing protein [Candidatus Obscuribacterales bacterium]|nr:DUF1501 domain-containing protein [Candidatus Obscuribacterales bacterium]
MSISRRKFLVSGMGAFGAMLAAPQLLNLLAQQAQAAPRTVGSSKILILIQLSGGNDGLNTVIPYTDPAYLKLRPAVGIKPEAVIKLNDKVALNPGMDPFADLFKAGKLAIVQGVGYPNPNRSHFRSIEIWQTAEPKKIKDTGWIGRYLDLANSGKSQLDNIFPAINVDPILPKTLSAEKIVVPSINDVKSFTFKADPRYEADRKAQLSTFNSIYQKYSLDRPYVNELRRVGLDTTEASDYITKLVADYKDGAKYPTNAFGKGLQFISQLIVGGVNCGVYTISMGGYDTHTNQQNSQLNLFKTLTSGIQALQNDLENHGVDKDVVIMTFSEFGRRTAENGGRGTDHGAAAPLFIIGSQVKGGIIGEQPSLTDLDDGDLKYKIDFRNVYASVLDKWMGADSKQILGDKFDMLDLFQKT